MTVPAEDHYGNTATSFIRTVNLALNDNSTGDTPKATVNLISASGVAKFTGLTLVKATAGYAIRATSTGLASAVTTPLGVVAASQLVVTT